MTDLIVEEGSDALVLPSVGQLGVGIEHDVLRKRQ